MADETPEEAIERESLAWVNRILAGPLTLADAEALTAWRARSPVHQQMLADAVRFQRKVRRAIELERGGAAQADAPPPAPADRKA